MIRQLIKFSILSWKEQWLFVETFCLTGVVRLSILLLPFRWLAITLEKQVQESSIQENNVRLAQAKRIGWIVEMVSHYTPWKSKCLVKGIVGKILLRRRGIGNTLYLGMGRDNAKNLVAHAWLICGETILTGEQGVERFSIVGKFIDSGGKEFQ